MSPLEGLLSSVWWTLGQWCPPLWRVSFCRILDPWNTTAFVPAIGYSCARANGLAIPYVGYLEFFVELCGKVMPGCGIVVVKDVPGAESWFR